MFHIYMLKLNKSHMSAMHVQIDELTRNGVNVSIIMNIITFTQTHTSAHKILYTHIHLHNHICA
jgi:hypothetical protein